MAAHGCWVLRNGEFVEGTCQCGEPLRTEVTLQRNYGPFLFEGTYGVDWFYESDPMRFAVVEQPS